MECELLEEAQTTNIRRFTNIFNETFPYYLSIGMTYDQFFNDDVNLVRYYREAEKLKNKRQNEEFWLQGLYIYDAFSTVTYNANRPKDKKAINYTEKPFDLYGNDNLTEEDIKREQIEKARVWMNNFVNAYK